MKCDSEERYLKEYKLDAVVFLKNQNYNWSEVVRNLAINPNMLGSWVKDLDNDERLAFRGGDKLAAD